MKKNTPDYKKIYNELINLKYPDKRETCGHLLSKANLSTLDIIEISGILSNENPKENFDFNQKHRSYNKSTVLQILKYQKKNKLNNSQLALHFKLSTNTIVKWKKQFQV